MIWKNDYSRVIRIEYHFDKFFDEFLVLKLVYMNSHGHIKYSHFVSYCIQDRKYFFDCI